MIDLKLGDGSIDAIITDPPYPEISREYGRMTEAEWHEMMRGVVAQARRVLKPTGSAVFILQPNSERVGRMRPWLWEFMAWTSREWNQVQDAWWWNNSTLPSPAASQFGLMRSSVKACVWLGSADCYRDQMSVLNAPAKRTLSEIKQRSGMKSSGVEHFLSGHVADKKRVCESVIRRGGTTPFNLIATGRGSEKTVHPAQTPLIVADYWTRYICPLGGTILDPFMGSGTTGLSALKYGCSYVGIEKKAEYHAIAQRRLAAASNQTPLFAG
jgi:DNA modification methylase